MQQHSGQHLLSAVFHERFGLPTVSFHLGDSVSSVDLSGPQPSSQVLEGAARAANAVIFEDREITLRYGTAEQFARLGVRKPVERSGILRAIEIAGIDLQPCGGTHVRRTGQIGMILIRSCSKMRQDWRVEFVCGGRAEASARRDTERLARLAAQCKCAPNDVDAAVERLLLERERSEKNLRTLMPKLADAEAASRQKSVAPRADGTVVFSEVLESVEPEYLQLLATALTRSGKSVALLALKETGSLVFAQNPAVGKEMDALLKRVVGQLGGKGGGTRDFARGAPGHPDKAPAALDLAKTLL
jgi:alanyl-tRNA synthetase